MLGYAVVSEAPSEDICDREGEQPPSPSLFKWSLPTRRLRGLRQPCAATLSVSMLATTAVVGWLGISHRKVVVDDVSNSVELKAASVTFLEASWGARGCPSGTVVVPNADRCKQYAAGKHDQGLCAKHHGYGPDCDGPVEGRAPWCASRPLGCWQSSNGCTYYKESGSDEPQLDVRPICQVVGRGPPKRDSLFCFSLLDTPTEKRLLKFQQKEGLGVFACDNHTVYSSKEIELAPGTHTTAIHINTTCNMGGPFKTCLNAWIFIEVWKNILSDGRFRRYAWTVKLDADAVFFPKRAGAALKDVWDPPRGVYVVNCQQGDSFGLHGPVEVFSRNAVEGYGKGWHMCVNGSGRLHFDLWGEDLFMDECMKKLGVYRRQDRYFLLEPHCDAPDQPGSFQGEGNKAWESCTYNRYIAFHPFEKEERYRSCVRNATQQREGEGARSHILS